jgi:hypothetical protein
MLSAMEDRLIRPRLLVPLMAALLAACGGGVADATSTTPTDGDSTAQPASVICDAFAEGGPVDRTTDAVIENLEGQNPAQATREAITGYGEIAERASGEERDDLLALTRAMKTAEMSGEGVNGWNAASEAFYVKYAEQCGFEVAD